MMIKVFTPPPQPMLVYALLANDTYQSDEIIGIECREVFYAQEPGDSRILRTWRWFRGPNDEVRTEAGIDLPEVQAARFSDLVAAARAHAVYMALQPNSAVLLDWYRRAETAQEGGG